MARNPIEREFRGLQTPRERVWAAVLASPKVFTQTGVQDLCSPMVRLEVVTDYLQALENGGFVLRVGGGTPTGRGAGRTEVEYTLLERRPLEAPRLSQAGNPVTQGLATTAMWRAMKVLKVFDWHQLASAASLGECVVSPQSAKSYTKALVRSGYLQAVRPSKPGTAALLRLVRNTGPHAPAITRAKTVFDRNTGEFAVIESAQEVCDGIDA